MKTVQDPLGFSIYDHNLVIIFTTTEISSAHSELRASKYGIPFDRTFCESSLFLSDMSSDIARPVPWIRYVAPAILDGQGRTTGPCREPNKKIGNPFEYFFTLSKQFILYEIV